MAPPAAVGATRGTLKKVRSGVAYLVLQKKEKPTRHVPTLVRSNYMNGLGMSWREPYLHSLAGPLPCLKSL